jgi:tetratricopeptide (TPR) repeat protein
LEAMKYYRAAIRINPDEAKAHMNLGLILEGLGQYNEALRELTEAARLAPKDVGIHFDMGCVFVELGCRDKAIEQFTEALRLNPDLKLAELRLQELGVDTTPFHSPSTRK